MSNTNFAIYYVEQLIWVCFTPKELKSPLVRYANARYLSGSGFKVSAESYPERQWPFRERDASRSRARSGGLGANSALTWPNQPSHEMTRVDSAESTESRPSQTRVGQELARSRSPPPFAREITICLISPQK